MGTRYVVRGPATPIELEFVIMHHSVTRCVGHPPAAKLVVSETPMPCRCQVSLIFGGMYCCCHCAGRSNPPLKGIGPVNSVAAPVHKDIPTDACSMSGPVSDISSDQIVWLFWYPLILDSCLCAFLLRHRASA